MDAVSTVRELLPVFTAMMGVGVSWGMLRGEIHALRAQFGILTDEIKLLREWRHSAEGRLAALQLLAESSKVAPFHT